MARSRTNRGDKEYDQLDKLKHENRRLKRQISQLRKLIDRFDLDRFEHVKELIESHEQQERLIKNLQKEKAWKCHDCGKGTLRLRTLDRRDGTFYNRVCDNCNKRTRLKRYTPDVEES